MKDKEILETLLIPLKLQNKNIKNIKIPNDPQLLKLKEEFKEKLLEKLNKKPAKLFKIITSTPIPYTIIPRKIRDKLLRTKTEKQSTHRLELEEIRQKILEKIIRENNITTVDNRRICVITHDIDTEKGLKRALRLKKIEEKYEVESTWFIPTQQYKLGKKIVKRLSENSEIASHSTKHDGKLILLRKNKKVERLRQSKAELEEIIEREVVGFRTPLLQHNLEIIEAVKEAGYKYDSSTPTWEPLHPTTMKPNGIQLTNPLKINGIIEVPVTLPQDHQMLHILKLTPKQTIKQWIKLMKQIIKLRGISVFLIHPEYGFANREYLEDYQKLIKTMKEMKTITLNNLLKYI